MWHIKNPTIKETNLDFTGSGQGVQVVSQLKSDEVVLMNALELIEWRADRTQVLICDHCGISGCSSGNWISLRVAGESVLLIPAFDEMEADSWSSTEYGPPQYLRKQGTPYFDSEGYNALVDANIGFPSLVEIPTLQMREAMRLAQFEMPYKIFAEPPTVELIKEKSALVVAASDGEPSQHLETIQRILKDNYENQNFASLRRPKANEDMVFLFLDASEFIDWQALVKTTDGFLLMLGEEMVVEPIS